MPKLVNLTILNVFCKHLFQDLILQVKNVFSFKFIFYYFYLCFSTPCSFESIIGSSLAKRIMESCFSESVFHMDEIRKKWETIIFYVCAKLAKKHLWPYLWFQLIFNQFKAWVLSPKLMNELIVPHWTHTQVPSSY